MQREQDLLGDYVVKTESSSTLAIKSSRKPEIDQAISDLSANKQTWAELPIADRIQMLRITLQNTIVVADRWAALDLRSRKVPLSSPDLFYSYMNVFTPIRTARQYLSSLEQIQKFGRPKSLYDPQTRVNGQVSLQVFPRGLYEKLLYNGMRGELWFEPGVSPAEIYQNQAAQYREAPREGKLVLVLGNGNGSLVTYVDLIYKLINEVKVVLVKIHPVTEFMGEIIGKCFAPFIEKGFVRIVYGDAEVGEYICTHPAVDEVHLTGSDKTYESIVFGPGALGQENKRNHQPRFNKRVTGELGNVTPTIIVPGPWTEKDIEYHSDDLCSATTINNGFGCASNRIIIQHQDWPLREQIIDRMKCIYATLRPQKAYYPGALQRMKQAVLAHRNAITFGEFTEDESPFVFAPYIDPSGAPMCFCEEIFGPFQGETALAAPDIPAYIDKAIRFCNEQLWGTLAATILVHPKSLENTQISKAVERAITNLRYGSVGINTPGGFSGMMGSTAWGGYPGSPPHNIQSGTGWVGNTQMFQRIQKSVVYGPFRMLGKSPMSPTFKNSLKAARAMLEYYKSPTLGHALSLILASI